MTYLKISVPVYKKDKWEFLEKHGKIEVSSEVDNLSEGYEMLKEQIEQLLAELDATTRLAKSVRGLEYEIEEKANVLKNLKIDIEQATQLYEDLKIFLKAFGVDTSARRLTFDRRFLSSESSAKEVEVVSDDGYISSSF